MPLENDGSITTLCPSLETFLCGGSPGAHHAGSALLRRLYVLNSDLQDGFPCLISQQFQAPVHIAPNPAKLLPLALHDGIEILHRAG